MRLIIGMSGASGVIYGIRLLEVLAVEQVETHLVLSDSAKLNIAIETDRSAKEIQVLADEVYSNRDIAARLASGSFKTDGMIVAPCAVKTLSAIANSYRIPFWSGRQMWCSKSVVDWCWFRARHRCIQDTVSYC